MSQVRQLNGKTFYYHSEYPEKLQAHSMRDKLVATGHSVRITYHGKKWVVWIQ